MEMHYTQKFKKQFKKLPNSIQARFSVRLNLFAEDPTHPHLRVHPLKGKYAGYWNMNITGDWRAIYRMEGEAIVIFALIGTHSSLYG